MSASMNQTLAQFQTKWAGLPERDRRWLVIGITVLAVFALWSVALAPAWRTLAQADERHAALDQQIQRMQALAAQSRALQQQAAPQAIDSTQALEKSLDQWLASSAQLSVAGDRATVTLTSAPPEAVAQWLLHSRQTARTQPLLAELTRNAAGNWDGRVLLTWHSP